MKIAVVSHDAGASEILASYIKAHLLEAEWTLYAPAGSPFEKIADNHGLMTETSLDLDAFDALFFGTGWQEKIEQPFVQEAKRKHIPSFAFMDHWSSYKERFGYPDKDWRDNLPDYTVVSDEKAEQTAQTFKLPNVLRINNHYLQEQISSFKDEKVTSTDNLLFLSEPTDQVALNTYKNKNYWGFTQHSALQDILNNFEQFKCRGLHIRLHPSEKQQAYAKILKNFPHIKSQIYPAGFYPLEKDLLRAKVIIGFDTMALYTAALLSKPVISYLPSNNREFLLPLPKSHQLRRLDSLTQKHLHPIELLLKSDGISFATFKQKIKEFQLC